MNLMARLDALARSNANAISANVATGKGEVAEDSQDSHLSRSQTSSPPPEHSATLRVFRSFRIQINETAAGALKRLAALRGIDWSAAQSEMIPGDLDQGRAQLAADNGDGAEVASVECWLRLLEARALQFGWLTGSSATAASVRDRPLSLHSYVSRVTRSS